MRILFLSALLVTAATVSPAPIFRDYRCKIERVATSMPPPNPGNDFLTKTFVGKEFTVDRRSGVMVGTLKNAYITRPDVIDHGSEENSFKVVTTLRKEQGDGRGSSVLLLVVEEFQRGPSKPFVFVDNAEVYFGTCTHF